MRARVPMRSLTGSGGYPMFYDPSHPHADKNGAVQMHVAVAVKALGHRLPPGTEVHHVNENITDFRNENLVICQDRAYHQLLHRRMRALRACGHPEWRRCMFCKNYAPTETMVCTETHYDRKKRGTVYHHRACVNAYQRQRMAARKLAGL